MTSRLISNPARAIWVFGLALIILAAGGTAEAYQSQSSGIRYDNAAAAAFEAIVPVLHHPPCMSQVFDRTVMAMTAPTAAIRTAAPAEKNFFEYHSRLSYKTGAPPSFYLSSPVRLPPRL